MPSIIARRFRSKRTSSGSVKPPVACRETSCRRKQCEASRNLTISKDVSVTLLTSCAVTSGPSVGRSASSMLSKCDNASARFDVVWNDSSIR